MCGRDFFSGFKTSSYNLMIPRMQRMTSCSTEEFCRIPWHNSSVQRTPCCHHLHCVSTLQCVRYSVQIDGILFPYEYTWNLFICRFLPVSFAHSNRKTASTGCKYKQAGRMMNPPESPSKSKCRSRAIWKMDDVRQLGPYLIRCWE